MANALVETRDELHHRIALLFREQPELKTELAQDLGVSERTLSRWSSGFTSPDALMATKIAVKAGVSPAWLIFGAPFDKNGETADGDVVWVPRFDVRASAGRGRVATDPEERVADVAFRSTWLRDLGVMPANAQFLVADGDSMEPTILNGDLLLVDRQIDQVVSNSVYVVVLAGHVMVKRLQLLFDGSIMLISDNPRYQPERVDRAEVERLQVEGRVRWYGRAI